MKKLKEFCLFVLRGLLLAAVVLAGLSPLTGTRVVQAEGSREINSSGKRVLTEWRTDLTGGLLRRRTLLQVYARDGEVINLGSSAIGLTPATNADIVLWLPGRFPTFASTQTTPLTPDPDFSCKTAQPGKGRMTTRVQEVAGPLPAANGYDPCVYDVTSTGIYYVAFYGVDGANAASNAGAAAAATTINAPVTDNTQLSGVSMFDVTVRTNRASTIDLNGRLYTDYLAAYSGGNGDTYKLFSNLYTVTPDGFHYLVNLNGLDPNGFLIYGNTVGNYHPDGVTPLYHDVVFTGNALTTTIPTPGTQLAKPTSKMFFNPPAADLPNSLIPTPVLPSISNIHFNGTQTGSTSFYSTGGDFSYDGNVGGIAEVIISRDGVSFDPTANNNRVLRSEQVQGTALLHWDGKANDGTYFPAGGPYTFKVNLHAGEYHFPMIDAENSRNGGPTITFQPPSGVSCPFTNCNYAFYDDRGYNTINPDGTRGTVGTVGTVLTDATNGITPPTTAYSITGYDTSTNQRAWGDGTGNGFGNWKSVDLWTYFPSSALSSTLVIVAQPSGSDLRITNTHTGNFQVGVTGNFTLTVSNVGLAAANSAITVSETLPAGLAVIPGNLPNGSGWNCSTSSGQSVVCTHPGGLAAGSTLPAITLPVSVADLAAPAVTTTASVSHDAGEINYANNSANDPVNVIRVDYGDLPASYAATLKTADNGASHILVPGGIFLGPSAGPKGDGTVSADSSADANDNGVLRYPTTPWKPGNTVKLTVSVTGGSGFGVAWFDWNGNGNFDDAGEQVSLGALNAGSNSVSLTVPAGYTTGQSLFARFRLYAANPGLAASYLGQVSNGEVEDYYWKFSPTAVTLSGVQARGQGSPWLPVVLLAAAGFLLVRRFRRQA